MTALPRAFLLPWIMTVICILASGLFVFIWHPRDWALGILLLPVAFLPIYQVVGAIASLGVLWVLEGHQASANFIEKFRDLKRFGSYTLIGGLLGIGLMLAIFGLR